MIENGRPWPVSTIVDTRLIYQFYAQLPAITGQFDSGDGHTH